MKTFGGLVALVYLALLLFGLVCSIYGLYLAFSASILLGIAVLLIEPAPLIIGLAQIGWGVNLAEKIVQLFQ